MTLPDQHGFVRIARALAPYLDQLVIGGAWCHRLLHFHPLANPSSFTTLMTEDADMVAHKRIQEGSRSIDGALVAGGFRRKLVGGDPPIVKYYPEDDDAGMYVEFIAPLQGSGYTRKGAPDDLLKIAGVTAQKLLYVDLLLFEPWQLELSAQHGFDVGSDELVVRVAGPGSYLAQKVLTLKRRQTLAKKPKDALYIHDTLLLFGPALNELRQQGAGVLDLLPAKTRRTFHELRVELFNGDDLVTSAAAIAASTGRASPPSPAAIRDACTVGLAQIFAP